jgi:hypothetical protein
LDDEMSMDMFRSVRRWVDDGADLPPRRSGHPHRKRRAGAPPVENT